VGAVLAAAGRSTRMGFDKLLADLGGRPVLAWSAATLVGSGQLDRLVIVAEAERVDELRATLAPVMPPRYEWDVVAGGDRRRDSVEAGARALDGCTWAVIHDGARPFLTTELLARGLDAAIDTGAAVAALPVRDTIKRVAGGLVVETPPRAELRAVQTPQVFRRDLLLRGLAATPDDVTDEAALMERIGVPVRLFVGNDANFKITTPHDLDVARALLPASASSLSSSSPPPPWPRVGNGFDCHALAPGRRLVLGGVEIPHDSGLAGHSDGDALAHALIDALLGAAARGDIGQWFPSSETRWAGADSVDVLLRTVVETLDGEGWSIVNVDATIVAQRPRLAQFVPHMRERLALALRLRLDAVSVKATTTDHLGALGRGEGIAAHAVATVVRLGGSQPGSA